MFQRSLLSLALYKGAMTAGFPAATQRTMDSSTKEANQPSASDPQSSTDTHPVRENVVSAMLALRATTDDASSNETALAVERTQAALRFYQMVQSSTALPPSKLGYGGSELILNNTRLHESPWHASCVELREKTVGAMSAQYHMLSYGHINFSALPKWKRTAEAAQEESRPAASATSNASGPTKEEAAALPSPSSTPPPPPPELEVVHYFETSTRAGLAGYQTVAQMVRRGQLPGRVENYTAGCGYGIWIVPREEYVAMLAEKGMLEA